MGKSGDEFVLNVMVLKAEITKEESSALNLFRSRFYG